MTRELQIANRPGTLQFERAFYALGIGQGAAPSHQTSNVFQTTTPTCFKACLTDRCTFPLKVHNSLLAVATAILAFKTYHHL